jgi:hypothetical protein
MAAVFAIGIVILFVALWAVVAATKPLDEL